MNYKKLSKIFDASLKKVEGVSPEQIKRLEELLKKDFKYMDVYNSGGDISMYDGDALLCDYKTSFKRLRYHPLIEKYITKIHSK